MPNTKDLINGIQEESIPKLIRKVKRQCNACGYVDYLLVCPKCGGGMFVYKNRI